MTTAIEAAPAHFAGRTTGCKNVTPLLASQAGRILAGNFRDAEGYCYVWLNLAQSSLLTGSEICKTTLHEMGHLNGVQHTSDVRDVMFSPFQPNPMPAACEALSVAKPKAKTPASRVVCPAGASNPDYCSSSNKRGSTKTRTA